MCFSFTCSSQSCCESPRVNMENKSLSFDAAVVLCFFGLLYLLLRSQVNLGTLVYLHTTTFHIENKDCRFKWTQGYWNLLSSLFIVDLLNSFTYSFTVSSHLSTSPLDMCLLFVFIFCILLLSLSISVRILHLSQHQFVLFPTLCCLSMLPSLILMMFGLKIMVAIGSRAWFFFSQQEDNYII